VSLNDGHELQKNAVRGLCSDRHLFGYLIIKPLSAAKCGRARPCHIIGANPIWKGVAKPPVASLGANRVT